MSLKVLVDRATDIPDNPTTLFVLLEFGKTKLATSHVIVRNPTSVRFNEEAEFGIKKSGNLRIQLCSATEKKKLLSTKDYKLVGRAMYPIQYKRDGEIFQVDGLQLKSKGGKPKGKISLKITVPSNSGYDDATERSNLEAMKKQSFSTYTLAPSLAAMDEDSPVSSRPPSHHGSLHQLAQPSPSPRSRPSSGIFDPMPKSSSLKRPKNSSDSDSIYKDEFERLQRQNDQLRQALKEKEYEVKDLKAYIDTMMVNIIEDAPDLLQAMSRPTNGTSSLKRSQSTRGSWFGGGR